MHHGQPTKEGRAWPPIAGWKSVRPSSRTKPSDCGSSVTCFCSEHHSEPGRASSSGTLAATGSGSTCCSSLQTDSTWSSSSTTREAFAATTVPGDETDTRPRTRHFGSRTPRQSASSRSSAAYDDRAAVLALGVAVLRCREPAGRHGRVSAPPAGRPRQASLGHRGCRPLGAAYRIAAEAADASLGAFAPHWVYPAMRRSSVTWRRSR